jgi:hypothetical protein
MKLLKLLISPFKDKFKLQRKVNTLELEKKELEIIIQSKVSETLMNTLSNQEEVERLTRENQRLRKKVKEIRNEK